MPPIPVVPLRAGLEDRMIALRRTLHRTPETGLYAPRTQASVINALRGLPLEIIQARGSSSVVALLRAKKEHRHEGRGPVVHRALMGAAPIEERTTEPFASRNGAMHADGADLETATLVGAISHMCAAEANLRGDVMCVFQAGEPGQGALESLLDDGLLGLCEQAPSAIYAARFESETPAGAYRIHQGQATAEVARFAIRVYRYGSPFDRVSVDSQRVAAIIVQALYSHVDSVERPQGSRLVAGVVNMTTSLGARPAETTIVVTCASADAAMNPSVVHDLGRIALTVAAAENALAVIGDVETISAVHNEATAVSRWSATASAFAADGRCHMLERPASVADDLALLLSDSPGAIGHFGAASPMASDADRAGMHSSATVFDDGVMSNVAAFLATLTHASLD